MFGQSDHAGEAVFLAGGEIQLRISRRARRLRIDVSARRGVVVVVPEGTPREVVSRFVIAKRRWIRRARDRVRDNANAIGAETVATIPEQLELRALGEQLTVVPAGRQYGKRVERVGDELFVPAERDATALSAALVPWLKQYARTTLLPRLAAHARHNGLHYSRTAVRGQRTRWASCSGRGTISLNYKLLFLPAALVDHVMLHELAHTRHLNHSPRFWQFLAELDPQWRTHHAALTRAARWVPAWAEAD